mgnify:CR=1 FL=1
MTPGKLSIDFDDDVKPTAEIIIPAAPEGVADKIVEANAGDTAAREQLVCTELLDEKTKEKAQKKAQEIYEGLIADTNGLILFGEESVERLNNLVESMRKSETPVDIPVIAELMRKTSYAMSGLKDEYDISDPKISKRIDDEIAGKIRLFNRGTSFIKKMRVDLQTVEQQIDVVEAGLVEKIQMLLTNIRIYDQLYIENERQIMGLIRDISVMEQVLLLARKELHEINSSPTKNLRESEKRAAQLNQFIQLLQNKIADYKNHMFVGSTNSQQIMHARSLAVGLAMRLNNQMKLTVPTMKSTMFRWMKAIETRQAAELSDNIAESANEWMVTLAGASEQNIADLAHTANAPTLTAETIARVAQSAVNEADSMLKAYLESQDQRSRLDDAMVKGQRNMRSTEEKMNNAVIDAQVDQASRRLSGSEE